MSKLTTEKATYESGNKDFPPDTLAAAIKWFSDKLAAVPQQEQPFARVTFEVGGYQDSPCVSIEISYERPETPLEHAQRVAAEQRDAISTRNMELMTLHRLLQKYGPLPEQKE